MHLLLETAFWTALALLAWTYAGYPLVVAALGLARRRLPAKAPVTPPVSVIHVARDHDTGLEIRIREAHALDYPADRLEVLVAPAGPLGRLAERIAAIDDPRVRLVDVPGRGWTAARNAAAAAASGDVLVFPDPLAALHPDAVRHLVRGFADPEVGAICGNRVHLRTRGEDPSFGAERLYADWDKWLAAVEMRSGSLPSIGRTFWAARRSLWRPVREGRNPDFAASTAVAALGSRITWEPRAVCYERGGDARHRFDRRVRTVRGNLRVVADDPRLLDPFRHGFRAVSLLSHGPLRWLTPVLVVAMTLAAWLLGGEIPGYRLAAAALPAWLAIAALGGAARSTRWGRMPWLCVPLFVCMAWGASIVALVTLPRFVPRTPTPRAHLPIGS